MEKDTFKDFIANVKEMITDAFGNEYTINVAEYLKNNGVVLTGLSIIEKDSNGSPIIYLDNFYDYYMDGLTYDEIISKIKNLYLEHKDIDGFDEKAFFDFKKASEKIIYRLINYKENKNVLDGIPNRRILDLAVVYYYVVELKEDFSACAMITNAIIEKWNISEGDLYDIARVNTPKMLPCKIKSIQEVINKQSLFEFGMGDKSLDFMYVCSNQLSSNGAVCMIYPKVLSEFSSAIDEDLYILPSSVHEVILLPASSWCSAYSLREMVASVNENEVMTQEVLSNNVYRYERSSGDISIA